MTIAEFKAQVVDIESNNAKIKTLKLNDVLVYRYYTQLSDSKIIQISTYIAHIRDITGDTIIMDDISWVSGIDERTDRINLNHEENNLSNKGEYYEVIEVILNSPRPDIKKCIEKSPQYFI